MRGEEEGGGGGVKKLGGFWFSGSEDALDTARVLFDNQKYMYALFFCHLAVEKALKGLVVQTTREHAPYKHNLAELGKATGISFDDSRSDLIDEVNTFNIQGRYEDFKNAFRQKATREYADEYLQKVTSLCVWLTSHKNQ